MLRSYVWGSAMTGLISGTLWLNGGVSRAPLPAQAAPSMALAEGVSGYPLERTACLAIRVGAAASTECGDLRVSHALPGVRVFNQDVTPTLTYNSEHAHPHLSVPLHVTQLSTTTPPDFVEVTIYAGPAPNPTAVRATKTWPGSEWPSGQTTTRRLTISYDALTDTTGMYFYRVKVANLYGATRIEWLGSVTGTRNLVNRSQSPFGAGWWLSGLEQVKKTWTPAGFNQQRLWIGGDGSTRIFIDGYQLEYDRLDSLKKNPAGTVFTRDMPEGRRMEFNSVGQHIKTINRFGRITTFNYSSGRLSSIQLPAPTGLTYTLAYGNPNTKLSTITAPALGATARVTTVTMPAGRITGIKNPGDSSVTFNYLTGTSDNHLMSSRTDRRGTATTYTYDAAYKFRSSTVNPGFGGAPIVWTVQAAESRGAAGTGTPSSLDTLQNTTRIEGPRPVADNTEILQERFGSPRKAVDALGNTTWMLRGLHYGVPSWGEQGWVLQRLKQPGGLVLKYTYESRGNLTRMVDSIGTTAAGPDTTRYVWHQGLDQLERMVPPAKDSVMFGLHASNGRVEWEKNALGDSTKILYTYGGAYAEEVTRVTLPAVNGSTALHDYTYHASLRNLATAKTPAGYVTTHTYDAIGRRIKTTTPIESDPLSTKKVEQGRRYSLRGDLLTDSSITVGVTPVERSVAETTYDPEGATQKVISYMVPDPQGIVTSNSWRYDLIGRPIAVIPPNGQVDSLVYDEQSNVTKKVTRRGHHITMAYDLRNALVERITPQVSQGDLFGVLPLLSPPVPEPQPRFPYIHAPVSGGGYYNGVRVPADTATFTYDSDGRMRSARNRDAHIGRTYSVRGHVLTDTAKIAVYDRVETPSATPYDHHVYVLSYTYDRNGRRLTRTDPAIIGGGSNTATYDPQSGLLQTLTDQFSGQSYTATMKFDARGRQYHRVLSGGGVSESWAFDNDDRVEVRTDGVLTETYSYDGRAKRTQIDITSSTAGLDEIVSHTYAGLGAMTQYQTTKASGIVDDYTVSPLGHVLGVASLNGDTHSQYTHERPVGPAAWIAEDTLPGADPGLQPTDPVVDTTLFGYDLDGNQTNSAKRLWQWNLGSWSNASWVSKGTEWTWALYGADNTLRVSQRSWNHPTTGARRHALVEHRYDALGRRVLTRTQADSSCTASAPECVSTIDRFVWDGDQLLTEHRLQAPYTTHGYALETETGGGSAFYGRIRYAQGPDIDRPLFFWKDGEGALVPHWNFRGMAAIGSVVQTGVVADYLVWPGRDAGAYFGPDTRVTSPAPNRWLGSLMEGQADATGLLYRRNRYFSPGSAQFTQLDPIGIAGGLNLYGFGGGDPVNFSDPFGLCPSCLGAAAGVVGGWALAQLTGSDYTWKDAAVDAALGAVGAGLLDKLNDFRKVADKADEGIVYLRKNLKTGEEYVGRTKSDAAFLNRQAAHDSRLGTRHQYTVLERAPNGTPLRVAEESAIRQRGGPGRLANKRYEMNDAAYRAGGGSVPKP